MKTNNILSGTALAFLLAEKTETSNFPEITNHENEFLIGEKEVGDMTDLEKTVYTAMDTKSRELESEFEKMTGIKPDMDPKEKERLQEASGEPTDEQAATLCKLKAERAMLHDLLFNLIKARIHEAMHADTLALRPGFKIVTGTSPEAIMSKLFGGHGVAMIGIELSKKD
ncbi:MAG: hypothetical protein KBC98_02720 [Candidatus Pacebacteria bacterium]|jgi:hypothetical protein|nr:hypothetical protein [Candidatus Paceibacterota bacterium]